VVSVELRNLIAGAADLYLASGNEVAAQVARLMRSAVPQRPCDPPQVLPILDLLPSIMLPGLDADIVPKLPWTEGGFILPDEIRGRNAYAELIGPEGPLRGDEIRFGFYLQAPDCLYPAHSHAAEELYLILSGAVDWRLDGVESFVPPIPGLVHHMPWQRHEMRTRQFPLLAMWAWIGDISFSTYSISP
jgi:hypothetical protein